LSAKFTKDSLKLPSLPGVPGQQACKMKVTFADLPTTSVSSRLTELSDVSAVLEQAQPHR